MPHKPPSSHTQLIFGTRAITETVKAGKTLDKVFVDKAGRSPQLRELLALLRQQRVPYSQVPAIKLRKLTPKNHQGAVALLSPIDFAPLSQVVQRSYEQAKAPLILVMDGITDVKNFGAIVRTAACTGVDAVVVPTQRSAALGDDAMKTSAGALAHVPICREANLKEALRYLQESGLYLLACHERASRTLYATTLDVPLALLLGAEDRGISPEYLKLVDGSAKIPMVGPIGSLNVSVAAGVALYEVVRQRSAGG